MRFIFDVIKGIFIGVSNIIPGVSGGTMAVSMGVYDRLINSINNLSKEFRQSVKTLLPIILGMIGGIAVFSYIIPYSLTNYAFQTCMCFTGLVIGGIPQIIGETSRSLKKEEKKFGFIHAAAFIIMLGIAVWMAVANGSSAASNDITLNFGNVILLIALGMITAATMIIPGVSGSLVLMILGYYTAIVSTVRDFFSSLKALDGNALLHCILMLIPFAAGCIAGILLISKLISWLFKKFESITYSAILGLIFASPFAIFYKMEACTLNAVTVITGVLFFSAAAAFTFLFSKKTKA